MGYRFALFDADNTLLDFTAAEDHAIKECLLARGLPTDSETISLYSAINDGHWKRLEQGLTTRDRLRVERFSDFFRAVGYGGDPVAMADDYVEALSRQTQLIDGALELISSLHGRCKLYIVTNGTEWIQRGRLADSGLLPYMQGVFISDLIGYPKPRVEFFSYVAEHIPAFDRARTVIVGDSLSSDMAGGIAFGIDTCWYNPDGASAPAEIAEQLTAVVSDFEELERWLRKGEAV